MYGTSQVCYIFVSKQPVKHLSGHLIVSIHHFFKDSQTQSGNVKKKILITWLISMFLIHYEFDNEQQCHN